MNRASGGVWSRHQTPSRSMSSIGTAANRHRATSPCTKAIRATGESSPRPPASRARIGTAQARARARPVVIEPLVGRAPPARSDASHANELQAGDQEPARSASGPTRCRAARGRKGPMPAGPRRPDDRPDRRLVPPASPRASASVTTTNVQSPARATPIRTARVRGNHPPRDQRSTSRPAISTSASPRATVAMRNGWKIVNRRSCRTSMATQAPPSQTRTTREHDHKTNAREALHRHPDHRKRCQHQVSPPGQPLGHPPEMGQHVLGILKLDGQGPEILRRQALLERASRQ